MKKFRLFFTGLFLFIFHFGFSQSRTITGKVNDNKGQPLPFATILIKGSSTAVQSDPGGHFSIKVAPSDKKLVVSFVGFENQEVKIGKSDTLLISLKPSGKDLEEVVVVGYGTKYEDDGSGYLLSGRVPGLQVNSGKPRARTTGGYDVRRERFNTEEYDPISENAFHKASLDPLSTFSIDVDAASYSNVRRFLDQGELPPPDAVRIEELINYFKYDYEQPSGNDPFFIHTEVSACPWNTKHKLVMVGLQGKKIPVENLPASNIVFLIDVSGSMHDPMKLPLVQSSLKMLTDQLREQDRISIVVYAGAAGLVLPPTSGAGKVAIKTAIDRLQAGGSTAGGEGIALAYRTARENFIKGGNNRIVLCTDGDFNVGVSSNGDLERMIEKERESGVFLTVLGYGMGNYKDSKMEILADKGNGNHAYIDGENEARKVLVNEFGGTLFTIAKDVKLQVEFNPAQVQGYRLVGYENRMLNKEDFNDDKKDAGDLGSGHTVTALYEIIPVGVQSEFLKDVDDLKYQKKNKRSAAAGSDELLTVKFRYKQPDGNQSKLLERVVIDAGNEFSSASENLRFAASVAEFGMLLRHSEFSASSSYEHVLATAHSASSFDREGYRKEFVALVKKAATMARNEKDVSKK